MTNRFQILKQKTAPLVTDRHFGVVQGISGLIVTCEGLEGTVLGSRCLIADLHGAETPAEVIAYKDGRILLMPFSSMEGVGPGCRVYLDQIQGSFPVSDALMGRVINALGKPIDSKGPLGGSTVVPRPLKARPPSPASRQAIGHKLDTGVRAFNTFLTICQGQRMGIFSGSGVGKSTLMAMVARFATADINVIGLVGERGREVREFIDQTLGAEGLKKSIVIVATSDEPPLMRRQAAFLTMTIAEYFRDEGKQVMLMMDSVTRFAIAQREIGLSAGEPPTTRGYTPSVFAEIPKLLERAGPGEKGQGHITAIFTVLVEGSDMEEPVADAVRGTIDGHIVLTRQLAERGHFPAIDILRSVSRSMPQCNSPEENKIVSDARQTLATYTNMEELIRLGAYRPGADPKVDRAIAIYPALERFLQQNEYDMATLSDGYLQLRNIIDEPKNLDA